MITLVIGGSGSGKSEFAESLCAGGTTNKYYIATMEPFGEEGAARIKRHHSLRAGKGFETIECYTHLENVSVPDGSTCLLECMSNLVANEMFSADGQMADSTDISLIISAVKKLSAHCKDLVIVSNNIFEDGLEYDDSTTAYMKLLGSVNRKLAELADKTFEVVCGIPIEK